MAQETIMQLTLSVHRFPDAKGLGVWLYKVAKTRCLMSRRRPCLPLSLFIHQEVVGLDPFTSLMFLTRLTR
jgi:DNA-directed RNA polymerase specialized sigma24 family protein